MLQDNLNEIFEKLSSFHTPLLLNNRKEHAELENKIFNIITSFREFLKSEDEKYFDYWELTEEGSTFINEKIINEIEYVIREDKSTLDKTALYEMLIMLFNIAPRNEKDTKYLTAWICPISMEPVFDSSEKIILSTGYIYNEKLLLEWYQTSGRFICPATNVSLPKFDVDRIVTLQQGLQKIVALEEEFKNEKTQLLQRQQAKFQRAYLSNEDEIKKCFLDFTSNDSSAVKKEQSKTRLRNCIQRSGIQQEIIPLKSSENFSNIDLSGLCFNNNNLKDECGYLDLRGSNLSGCTFLGSCSTRECMHADLTGANLEGARFLNTPGNGICIKTTNFTRANLRNADLTGVGNWNDVNLTEANLTGAFLYKRTGKRVSGEGLKKHLKDVQGIKTAIFDEPKINQTAVSTPALIPVVNSTPVYAAPAPHPLQQGNRRPVISVNNVPAPTPMQRVNQTANQVPANTSVPAPNPMQRVNQTANQVPANTSVPAPSPMQRVNRRSTLSVDTDSEPRPMQRVNRRSTLSVDTDSEPRPMQRVNQASRRLYGDSTLSCDNAPGPRLLQQTSQASASPVYAAPAPRPLQQTSQASVSSVYSAPASNPVQRTNQIAYPAPPRLFRVAPPIYQASARQPRNQPDVTFDEFKTAYEKDKDEEFFTNPFGMRFKLFSGICTTIEEVQRYADSDVTTRTYRVLQELKNSKR